MVNKTKVMKAGFIPIMEEPFGELLSLRLPDGYDLPKGKLETGESGLECALRELNEETGLSSCDIILVDDFRDSCEYSFFSGSEVHDARLELFLCGVRKDARFKYCPEHLGIRFMRHPNKTSSLFLPEKYSVIERAYDHLTLRYGSLNKFFA